MGKSKYFFGQPIFSQLISLIKKDRIESLAGEHKTDHYCKKFITFQHLITMSYGILSGCNSLREMCTGIVSYGDKISHCKFSYAPKRSTISDANSKRSYKVFEACYYDLLKRYSSDLSDSRTGVISDKKIFSIDSTTFSLFQPIFECVGRKATNGQSKGGIKSHQKLDLQMGIPVKVYNNHAREHDSVFIQQEDFLKENEIGVFDKAYNKYSAFAKWNTQNIFFVTRLKNNAKEELVEEYDLSNATPNEVLRDAKIKLKYKEDNEIKEEELRLVSYYDTNQLWCTLIVLLLVTVMQKALKTKWAFSNLNSLMQKHLFTYIKFTDFFDHMDKIMADIKFYNNKDEYIQPEIEGLTV